MTYATAVADAQDRLVDARSSLEHLVQSGGSEKTVECCCLVASLELQLQRLLAELLRPPA